FYGVVMWNKQPLALEDIRRIEVVRGPGSVLYGANAFHAVVNIITKAPGEDPGALVALTGGPESLIGTFAESGRTGKISHRVSAGWTQTSSWADREDIILKYPHGLILLDYDLGKSRGVALEAGLDSGDYEMYYDMLGMFKSNGTNHHLLAKFYTPDLYFRAFWNALESKRTEVPDIVFKDMSVMGIPVSIAEGYKFDTQMESNTLDLEAQKIQVLGSDHILTGGANFRYNTALSPLVGGYRTQSLAGAYVQHEFLFRDRIHSYLGVRYDYHPLAGSSLSPRASVLASPLTGHTFRVSYGRSFRNPTIVENYVDIGVPLNLGISVAIKGSRDISPERLDSVEGGYQSDLLQGRLRLGASFFHTWINGLVGPDLPEDVLGTISQGVSGSMDNMIDEKAWGVEAEVKAKPFPYLTGFANYTYTHVYNELFQEIDRRTPQHKANGGVTLSLDNGLSATLLLNYVGPTRWPHVIRFPNLPETLWFLPLGPLDAYTLLNLRVGYAFLKKRAEVAVSVFNLLGDKHREYPAKNIGEVDRRITGRVQVNF
ncbi:MAG: TonB-dependent receptor, partial [Proteobacteria bacterium]|nr:TonB-dependent receptor [Pseudomonadota bacterium]